MVFISRGMTVAIPPGGLTISMGPDGKLSGNLSLHVRFDVCPTWVEIALKHLDDAIRVQSLRRTAWNALNEDQKAAALEQEFASSMQAIVAAATAIDAFYAIIKAHLPLPEAVVTKWRQGNTSRYSQIAEVLRLAFSIKPRATKELRQNLKEIYRFRDLAVHPSGKIEAPVYHAEMGHVEWRFAYFCEQNAQLLVKAAIEILLDIASNGNSKEAKINDYIHELHRRLVILLPENYASVP